MHQHQRIVMIQSEGSQLTLTLIEQRIGLKGGGGVGAGVVQNMQMQLQRELLCC